MLELLIVLIVIGVAAGITGLIVARDPGNLELRTTAKNISAVLRYARNHAVSEKKEYMFNIDEEENVYRLVTEKDSKNSPEEELGNGAGDSADYGEAEEVDEEDGIKVVISKEIPEGLQITFQEGSDEVPELVFFPQGHSSGAVIEVSRGTERVFFIEVNRITGKVVIEEAD